MKLSWTQPQQLARVRAARSRYAASWDELFDHTGAARIGPTPEEVDPATWRTLAEHVARIERVRELLALLGHEEGARRFANSPHAVERATLVDAGAQADDGLAVRGILECAFDQWLAYGMLLSRLIEVGLPSDPEGTVAAFEDFVVRAAQATIDHPSWPERVRMARDGLAALYVRVGRLEDGDRLYRERFAEEETDTAIAIGAGRAFLEARQSARAAVWLDRGAERAAAVNRPALAATLREKAQRLRSRQS